MSHFPQFLGFLSSIIHSVWCFFVIFCVCEFVFYLILQSGVQFLWYDDPNWFPLINVVWWFRVGCFLFNWIFLSWFLLLWSMLLVLFMEAQRMNFIAVQMMHFVEYWWLVLETELDSTTLCFWFTCVGMVIWAVTHYIRSWCLVFSCYRIWFVSNCYSMVTHSSSCFHGLASSLLHGNCLHLIFHYSWFEVAAYKSFWLVMMIH